MKTTEKNIPRTSDIGVKYLPEMHMVIYFNRIYHKKSYKEIAEIVNRSEDYCRQSVHRSKVKLKKLDKMLLGKGYSEEEMEAVINEWRSIRFEP